MLRILLAILFVTQGFQVSAQTLNDPFYLNYYFFPKTDFKKTKGDFVANTFEMGATAPAIKIGSKLKLYNALYYRNTKFFFSDSFSEHASLPDILHDIRYSLIVRAEINKYFEIVALPRLLIRSDLSQTFGSADIFPYFVLLGNYAVNGNPNFKIGVGIALNNDFSRNALIPTGTLFYDSKKVKIEISYPNANFLYKQNKNFEWGLFANVDGYISRIAPYQYGLETAHYLRSFQLLIAPTLSHRIHKHLFAHAKIGYAGLRNLEIMDKDFIAIQNQNFKMNESIFFRLGISYRLNDK
ncbi:MAG: hypothetical protein KA797_08145 [Chitinophagales bacterium]|nr:hypothetical protein [Chitinophagales bacterium]